MNGPVESSESPLCGDVLLGLRPKTETTMGAISRCAAASSVSWVRGGTFAV